jgi:hypothetical protein
MIDFLFLGIIPGTHVQITFGMWLITFMVFAGTWATTYMLLKIRPLRKVRFITSVYLAAWHARRLSQQA